MVVALCWSIGIILIPIALATPTRSRCSWHQSGSADSNSIQKMILSCDRGKVQWSQPIGELQITLTPRRQQADKICFKVDTLEDDSIKIRLMTPNPIWIRELNFGIIECVEIADSVRLIMESINRNPWTKAVTAQVSYEVPTFIINSQLQQQQLPSGLNNCGQCTAKETGDAFCKADLVFEGLQMSQTTNIPIIVKRFIRRPIFYSDMVNEDKGSLTAPILSCSLQPSKEARIIIAQTLLGTVSVICAPTVNEFKAVAVKLGTGAKCQMT